MSTVLNTVIAENIADASTLIAGTLAEALSEDLGLVDVALCDLHLADAEGMGVLDELALIRPDLPVVVLAADADRAQAAEAIRGGAYDYVVKQGQYHQTIPIVIEKALALYRLRQEHARLRAQLTGLLGRAKSEQARMAQIAATDPLTGLANRRSFMDSLERRFADGQRTGQNLAVILIDLDAFKPLNDTMGHAAGDRVLLATADALRRASRRSDTPGRLGGDEFVLLLPGANDAEALTIAHRILRLFPSVLKRAFPEALQNDPPPGMSIGLATVHTSHAMTAEQLLESADVAMYHAKAQPGGPVAVHRGPHGASLADARRA